MNTNEQTVRNRITGETGRFLYRFNHALLGALIVADWRMQNGAVYQRGVKESDVEVLS